MKTLSILGIIVLVFGFSINTLEAMHLKPIPKVLEVDYQFSITPIEAQYYLDFLKNKGLHFEDLIANYNHNVDSENDYFLIDDFWREYNVLDKHDNIDSITTASGTSWTISGIRAAITLAADQYKNSAPFAHKLLIHSLQDNPRTMHVRESDGGINRDAIRQIRNNSSYINTPVNQVVSFKSPRNLYWSLGNCTKRRSLTQTSQTTYLYDYYDYEWTTNFSDAWTSTINNLAWIAQGMGAIQNYHVYVYVEEIYWDPGISPWSTIDLQ